MVTLKEIAKEAGVSESTVSRVVNNRPGISEKTRQLVVDIVKKRNYHPDVLARGLAGTDTKTIGVIFPRISNLYYAELLQGIQEVAGELGYNVVLFVTNNDTKQAHQYLRVLKAYHASGVIYQNRYFDAADQEGLAASRLPAVVINRRVPAGKFYAVVLDEAAEAARATQYLIDLGHRRLAFIGGPIEDPWPGRLRLAGFKRALHANRIKLDEDLIAFGDWTFKSGYAAMEQLLAKGKQIEGVFAASDEMAIGAMKAMQAHGMSIPEDVSVIGFDGVPLGVMSAPELTTMEQPIREMGRASMRILFRLIQGEHLPEARTVFACRLLERKSCMQRVR